MKTIIKFLIGMAALTLATATFPALANSCWAGAVSNVNFGAVGPAGGTAVGSFSVVCQKTWTPAVQTNYFRLCLTIPGGSPISTLNPRRMSNYDSGQMQYELYLDAAHTQQIGGSSTTFVHTATMIISGAGSPQMTSTFPVYGRVFPGQNLPAGAYQSQNYANIHWVSSTTSMPPVAACVGSSTLMGIYQGASANWDNSCAIAAVGDMTFGAQDNLTGGASSQTTLSIICPTGTAWQAGLNNGQNFASGTRRMARSGGGGYINYGLYQNSTHTNPWGSVLNTNTRGGTGTGSTQAVTIYGHVPAQSTPLGGDYEDTVQVTLTY